MAKVLKAFRWSPNGYDLEQLEPGDERDFRSLTAGLAGEGFIEDTSADASIEIEPVMFPEVDDAPTKPTGRRKRN